jgi:class 3 adenylate cyclase/tetratricopeptide (TPR) repeat protein
MSVCPSCGIESAASARFCAECGTPLRGSRIHTSERKIVTSLFCDLVGFTALTERADPEDVGRLLSALNALAKRVVRSYGGVVEKFIGDAVVAVFGVPAVREDDPERAVRAGLRLLEGMAELPQIAGEPIRARVGVNTGRVLVRLNVDPQSGEGFLLGDAVNTAARLQAVAPPMGLVVGEATYALTADRFEYEELGPVTLKGKAAPLPHWLAKRSVTRTGVELNVARSAELVGRTAELDALTSLVKDVSATGEPRFALLLGEAGIGKSRLIFELARFVDEWPELVIWRQGSCPPYGDVSPFSALAQIVQAHAGILESDDPAAAAGKLDEMLSESAEGDWLGSRLRPLLGLDAPPASAEENAAAWQRFLEDLAGERPAVLIFEDLHWADPSLVSFLQGLAEKAAKVPLLVVGAARPELLEDHPGLASSAGRVDLIELKSLPPDAAAELAARLLRASDVPEDMRDEVVRQCGGNPLYTEELVRLLADQAAARDAGDAGAAPVQCALPDSLQALIAARLDVLRPERKALLADAAVVGQDFWLGALARVADLGREAVEAGLRELASRDLVRPVRESTVAGEPQYSFWHALTREVAYEELPRAARAAKHAAVADWLEHDSGARVDDLADVLAHHRVTSLELARASGEQELAARQLEPAVGALMLAGDRTLPLDVTAAEARYARAAALVPEDSPQRPLALTKWGKALMESGRFEACLAAFKEGMALLQVRGEAREMALAAVDYSTALCLVGDTTSAVRLHHDIIPVVEAAGPSPELVALLGSWAALCGETADVEAALPAAARALALAAELGLDTPVEALVSRADWRCVAGDVAGLDDFRRGLAEARAQGHARPIATIYYNYGTALGQFEGPQASLQLRREGLDFCLARHDKAMAFSLRYGIAHDLFRAGDWAAALAEAADLDPQLERAANWAELGYLRALEARLLVAVGRVPEAGRFADWGEELGHGPVEPILRAEAMTAAAGVRAAQGDDARAGRLLRECLALPGLHNDYEFDWLVPEAARIAAAIGAADLVAQVAGCVAAGRPLRPCVAPTVDAVCAECSGDAACAAALYREAATRWAALGVPYEHALASLGQGRCLMACGEAAGAAPALGEALALLTTLGAETALAEVRGLRA